MKDFGPISITCIIILFTLVMLLLVGAWTSVTIVFVFLVGWAVGIIAALSERNDRW